MSTPPKVPMTSGGQMSLGEGLQGCVDSLSVLTEAVLRKDEGFPVAV